MADRSLVRSEPVTFWKDTEGTFSRFVDPSCDVLSSLSFRSTWHRWGIGNDGGSAGAFAVLLSSAALGAHEAARISHRSLSAAAKREKSKDCGVAQLVVRMHKLGSFECRIKHDLAAANL